MTNLRNALYIIAFMLIAMPIIRAIIATRQAEQAEQAQREAWAAAEAEKRAENERRQAEKAAKQAERERKEAEREQIRAAKEAERQRKQAERDRRLAERLENARLLAEYAERELAAKRAAMELDRATAEPAQAETPAEHSEPVAVAEPVSQAEPVTRAEPVAQDEPVEPSPLLAGFKGNNAFKDQVVAFTGRLPGMTRNEAIQAVQANGGRAYTKMPAGTTLLVVGEKPGMRKMDKADEWIGQVRKITAKQFFEMLAEPMTVEPEELEAAFAAMYAA